MGVFLLQIYDSSWQLPGRLPSYHKDERLIGCQMLESYKVTHAVSNLGWIDLDLGSSLGWQDSTETTYCIGMMVQPHKSESTQPRHVTLYHHLVSVMS